MDFFSESKMIRIFRISVMRFDWKQQIEKWVEWFNEHRIWWFNKSFVDQMNLVFERNKNNLYYHLLFSALGKLSFISSLRLSIFRPYNLSIGQIYRLPTRLWRQATLLATPLHRRDRPNSPIKIMEYSFYIISSLCRWSSTNSAHGHVCLVIFTFESISE